MADINTPNSTRDEPALLDAYGQAIEWGSCRGCAESLPLGLGAITEAGLLCYFCQDVREHREGIRAWLSARRAALVAELDDVDVQLENYSAL